jgi:hypothetical protein
MCKKSIYFCLVLTLTMASAAYAGLPLVIGDWENGSTDGWENVTPVDHNQVDPPWPTLGTGSGQINPPPGWSNAVKLDLKGLGYTAEFSAAIDIHMDVKMVASEWADWFAAGGWVNAVDAIIMNSENGGWVQYDTPSWWPNTGPKPAPPPYYHDWDGTADEVFHYDWEFDALGVDPGGWCEIFIATNYDGAPEETPYGSFYIDNVVLTPEPTTIALLGLGGLSLLRRKRR